MVSILWKRESSFRTPLSVCSVGMNKYHILWNSVSYFHLGLHYITVYYMLSCYTMLYYVISWYIISYHIIYYYIMLYSIILYQTSEMLLENTTENPLDISSENPLDKWLSFGTYTLNTKLRWKTPLKIHWTMPRKIHDDFWGVGFLVCNLLDKLLSS